MTRILLSASNIEAIENGQEFALEPDVAKKLVRVLRLADGDSFIGFDGLGREWECTLMHVEVHKKPAARAVAVKERESRVESKLHLSVAQAIPKGDKMEFVLQKGASSGRSRPGAAYRACFSMKTVARVPPSGPSAGAKSWRQQPGSAGEPMCPSCMPSPIFRPW